jgi:hypothetical protein
MVCCFPGSHVGHIEAEDEGQGNEIEEGVEVFYHIFEKPKRKREMHKKTERRRIPLTVKRESSARFSTFGFV